MDNWDPSLRQGGRLVVQEESRVDVRVDEKKGVQQTLIFKIVQHADAVTLEVLAETDPFFHYSRDVGEPEFRRIQDSQRLMVNYKEFPALLKDMLTQKNVQSTLTLRDTGARLDFISVAHSFRHLDLLSLDLARAQEQDTRLLLAFRFNQLQRRLTFAEAKYVNLAAAIKARYPHVLSSNSNHPLTCDDDDDHLSSSSNFGSIIRNKKSSHLSSS